MALFDQVLSGISGAIRGITGSPSAVGGLLNIGTSALKSALAPSPPRVTMPVAAVGPAPVVRPVMSAGPQIIQQGARAASGAAAFLSRRGISGIAAAALIKIAQKTGRRTMSVRGAIKIIRRMGKHLPPVTVAAALGITLDEMAELIMENSRLPRRRMNPGNASALRRAHRRIESFHRLCLKNDILRGTRRRSSRSGKTCGSTATIVKA